MTDSSPAPEEAMREALIESALPDFAERSGCKADDICKANRHYCQCRAELTLAFDSLDASGALAAWNRRSASEREQHLEAALRDMLAGWRYIRMHHGDLYGVGWDRCEEAARAALAGQTEGERKP